MGNMSEGDDMEMSSDNKVSLCVAFWSLCLLHQRLHLKIDSFSKGNNFFNNLPDATTSLSDDHDELDCYLATDMENVKDALMWWHERHATFPHLSHMAWDYLSISGKCAIISVIFADILPLSNNCRR